MNEQENKDVLSGRNMLEEQGNSGNHFAAPIGSATSGRLQFVRAAANVIINAPQTLGHHFGGIGGKTRLESQDYAGATDRYEITVTGGASNVVVDTR